MYLLPSFTIGLLEMKASILLEKEELCTAEVVLREHSKVQEYETREMSAPKKSRPNERRGEKKLK